MLRTAALALLALLLLPARPSVAQRPEQPNVLLVSVDTLRADHLGSYGYPHPLTPNLDGMAEHGLLFEDVITTIGKTGPAFASIFSSLFPPTHGARRNGVELRPDVPVLAEILHERGYTTAAFISNWTLRDRLSGLARGFDHYDETFNRVRYTIKGAERDAPGVTRDALDWVQTFRRLESEAGKPIFLWVHYSEPHTPYDHHAGYGPPPPGGDEKKDGWAKRWRYASEVAFTDHWIGKLLAGLETEFPTDTSYRVFLSDHGESLGEHQYWGHGKNTYWPNLDVPLIMSGPGLPKGRRIGDPVSLVDMLPTLLELLHIELATDLEGQSLLGIWREPSQGHRLRYAIGERRTAITKKGRQNYEDPLMISMQSLRVKTIYDFDRRRLAYFDLVEDPLELEPLSEAPIDTVPPLRRRLANWYRGLAKYEAKTQTELSPEDVEQLKSLGYIGE